MDDNKLIQYIMFLAKKKYDAVEQIFSYTKDIQESLSQNDFYTVEMLLDMRANLMNDADNCDVEILRLKNELSEESRFRIACEMSDTQLLTELSFEEAKIKELYTLTQKALAKTIELNKVLEMKIAANTRLQALENS